MLMMWHKAKVAEDRRFPDSPVRESLFHALPTGEGVESGDVSACQLGSQHGHEERRPADHGGGEVGGCGCLAA